MQAPVAGATLVKISLTHKVPFAQQVVIKTPLLVRLKIFWIQYVAFLLPFYWLIYRKVLGYAYKNGIMGAV